MSLETKGKTVIAGVNNKSNSNPIDLDKSIQSITEDLKNTNINRFKETNNTLLSQTTLNNTDFIFNMDENKDNRLHYANKKGVELNPYLQGHWDKQVYDLQGELEVFTNSLLGLGANTLAGALSNFGANDPTEMAKLGLGIEDANGYGSGNIFYKWAKSLQDYTNKELAIFANPEDSGIWNWNYWARQSQSFGYTLGIILETIGEQALLTFLTASSGGGTGALQGAALASRAGRIAMTLAKYGRNTARFLAKPAVWGVYQGIKETMLNSLEVQDNLKHKLMAEGLSEEEAIKIASEAASENMRLEFLPVVAMNALQFGALAKLGRIGRNPFSMAATRRFSFGTSDLATDILETVGGRIGGKYFKKFAEHTLGKITINGLAEAVEEGWQEGTSNYVMLNKLKEHGYYSPFTDNEELFNDQWRDAMIGGFFGGAIFPMANAAGRRAYNFLNRESIQRMEEEKRKTLETIAQSTATLTKRLEALGEDATEEEREAIIQRINDNNVYAALVFDYKHQTTDGFDSHVSQLEQALEAIENNDDAKIRELGLEGISREQLESFKQKALELKENLVEEYNRTDDDFEIAFNQMTRRRHISTLSAENERLLKALEAEKAKHGYEALTEEDKEAYRRLQRIKSLEEERLFDYYNQLYSNQEYQEELNTLLEAESDRRAKAGEASMTEEELSLFKDNFYQSKLNEFEAEENTEREEELNKLRDEYDDYINTHSLDNNKIGALVNDSSIIELEQRIERNKNQIEKFTNDYKDFSSKKFQRKWREEQIAKERERINKLIEAIKNDSSLSQEEKKEKINQLLGKKQGLLSRVKNWFEARRKRDDVAEETNRQTEENRQRAEAANSQNNQSSTTPTTQTPSSSGVQASRTNAKNSDQAAENPNNITVQQVLENQKLVLRDKKTAEYYVIVDPTTGEEVQYARVHSVLPRQYNSNFAQTENLIADIVNNGYTDSSIIDAMNALGVNRFTRKTSEIANMSQEEREKFVEEIKAVGEHYLTMGNTLDAMVRDFFISGNVEKPEGMSEEVYQSIMKDIQKLQEELNTRGLRAITESVVLWHTFPNGQRVAGEVDVLLVDNDGNIQGILDIKTSKYPYYSNEFQNRRGNQIRSTKDQYIYQLSTYADLLQAQYGIRVNKLQLAVFNVQGERGNIESSNGMEMSPYLEYKHNPNIPYPNTSTPTSTNPSPGTNTTPNTSPTTATTPPTANTTPTTNTGNTGTASDNNAGISSEGINDGEVSASLLGLLNNQKQRNAEDSLKEFNAIIKAVLEVDLSNVLKRVEVLSSLNETSYKIYLPDSDIILAEVDKDGIKINIPLLYFLKLEVNPRNLTSDYLTKLVKSGKINKYNNTNYLEEVKEFSTENSNEVNEFIKILEEKHEIFKRDVLEEQKEEVVSTSNLMSEIQAKFPEVSEQTHRLLYTIIKNNPSLSIDYFEYDKVYGIKLINLHNYTINGDSFSEGFINSLDGGGILVADTDFHFMKRYLYTDKIEIKRINVPSSSTNTESNSIAEESYEGGMIATDNRAIPEELFSPDNGTIEDRSQQIQDQAYTLLKRFQHDYSIHTNTPIDRVSWMDVFMHINRINPSLISSIASQDSFSIIIKAFNDFALAYDLNELISENESRAIYNALFNSQLSTEDLAQSLLSLISGREAKSQQSKPTQTRVTTSTSKPATSPKSNDNKTPTKPSKVDDFQRELEGSKINITSRGKKTSMTFSEYEKVQLDNSKVKEGDRLRARVILEANTGNPEIDAIITRIATEGVDVYSQQEDGTITSVKKKLQELSEEDRIKHLPIALFTEEGELVGFLPVGSRIFNNISQAEMYDARKFIVENQDAGVYFTVTGKENSNLNLEDNFIIGFSEFKADPTLGESVASIEERLGTSLTIGRFYVNSGGNAQFNPGTGRVKPTQGLADLVLRNPGYDYSRGGLVAEVIDSDGKVRYLDLLTTSISQEDAFLMSQLVVQAIYKKNNNIDGGREYSMLSQYLGLFTYIGNNTQVISGIEGAIVNLDVTTDPKNKRFELFINTKLADGTIELLSIEEFVNSYGQEALFNLFQTKKYQVDVNKFLHKNGTPVGVPRIVQGKRGNTYVQVNGPELTPYSSFVRSKVYTNVRVRNRGTDANPIPTVESQANIGIGLPFVLEENKNKGTGVGIKPTNEGTSEGTNEETKGEETETNNNNATTTALALVWTNPLSPGTTSSNEEEVVIGEVSSSLASLVNGTGIAENPAQDVRTIVGNASTATPSGAAPTTETKEGAVSSNQTNTAAIRQSNTATTPTLDVAPETRVTPEETAERVDRVGENIVAVIDRVNKALREIGVSMTIDVNNLEESSRDLYYYLREEFEESGLPGITTYSKQEIIYYIAQKVHSVGLANLDATILETLDLVHNSLSTFSQIVRDIKDLSEDLSEVRKVLDLIGLSIYSITGEHKNHFYNIIKNEVELYISSSLKNGLFVDENGNYLEEEQLDEYGYDELQEIHDKQNLSEELRIFFSGINETTRNLEGKIVNVNTVFNIPRLLNYSLIYDKIVQIFSTGELTGSSYERMINKLKNNVLLYPYLADVIDKLENADEQTKNKFVYIMHKVFINPIKLTEDDQGNPKIIRANNKEVNIRYRTKWRNNFKNAVTTNGLVDGAKVAAIKKAYNELKEKIKTLDPALYLEKGIVEELHKLLHMYGLDLSLESVYYIVTRGMPIFSYANSALSNSAQFIHKPLRDVFFGKDFQNPLYSILRSIEDRRLTDNSVLLMNPFTSEEYSKYLMHLFLLEDHFDTTSYSSTYRDGGKTLSMHVNTRFSDDAIEQLRTKEYRDNLKRSSYSRNNVLLQALEDNEDYARRLVLEPFSNEAYSDTNKRYVELSQEQRARIQTTLDTEVILDHTNFESIARRYGLFFEGKRVSFPTLSDKRQSYTMLMPVVKFIEDESLPRHEVKGKDENGNEIVLESYPIMPDDFRAKLVEYLYEQLLLPELSRIVEFIKNRNSFDTNVGDSAMLFFYMIPEANTYMLDNGMHLLEFLQHSSDGIFHESNKQVLEQFKNTIINGVIDYFVGHGDNYTYLLEDSMQRINSLVSYASIHQTILGDVAYFAEKIGRKYGIKYDPNTREFIIPESLKVNTEEDISNIAGNILDSVGVNVGKRLAMLTAQGRKLANSETDSYVQVFLKDVSYITKNFEFIIRNNYGEEALTPEVRALLDKLYSENDSEVEFAIDELSELFPKVAAYLDNPATDAQEYTTAREHIDILFRQGRLEDSLYHHLIDKINKMNEKEANGETLVEEDLFTSEELKQVMQPLKPVYTGTIWDERTQSYRPVYIKSSSHPLIPQLTSGTELDNVRKLLNSIERKTGKNVRASYGSANKIGAPKKAINIFNNKGEFNKNLLEDKAIDRVIMESSIELDRNNFRIQLDTPYKSKEVISIGTQLQKVLFGDGVIDEDDFIIDGKKVKGKDLHKRYNDNLKQLIEIKKQQLYKRFYLDANGNSVNLEKTFQVIQEILITEGKEKGLSSYELDMLKRDITKKAETHGVSLFESLLIMSPYASKFESILISFINKNIFQFKLPGYSFIASSEVGMKDTKWTEEQLREQKDANFLSRIVYTDKYEGELKPADFIYNEQGEVIGLKSAQIMLPSKFRDNNGELIEFIYEDGTYNETYVERDETGRLRLKKGMIEEHLLKQVAFRIPTSSLVSSSSVEIVGFLPKEAGDMIIVPANFTTQKGMDYDIDKENLYSLFTHIDKDGVIREFKRMVRNKTSEGTEVTPLSLEHIKRQGRTKTTVRTITNKNKDVYSNIEVPQKNVEDITDSSEEGVLDNSSNTNAIEGRKKAEREGKRYSFNDIVLLENSHKDEYRSYFSQIGEKFAGIEYNKHIFDLLGSGYNYEDIVYSVFPKLREIYPNSSKESGIPYSILTSAVKGYLGDAFYAIDNIGISNDLNQLNENLTTEHISSIANYGMQVAISMNKPVFVYNRLESTEAVGENFRRDMSKKEGWYYFDYNTKTFKPYLGVPPLLKRPAMFNTSDVTESDKEVITEFFDRNLTEDITLHESISLEDSFEEVIHTTSGLEYGANYNNDINFENGNIVFGERKPNSKPVDIMSPRLKSKLLRSLKPAEAYIDFSNIISLPTGHKIVVSEGVSLSHSSIEDAFNLIKNAFVEEREDGEKVIYITEEDNTTGEKVSSLVEDSDIYEALYKEYFNSLPIQKQNEILSRFSSGITLVDSSLNRVIVSALYEVMDTKNKGEGYIEEDQLLEELEKNTKNDLVNITKAVLESANPAIQEKVSRVLSMDFAKSQVKLLNPKGISQGFHYIGDRQYQEHTVTLGNVGQMGIGVYSVGVVNNALYQQAYARGNRIQLKAYLHKGGYSEHSDFTIKLGKAVFDSKKDFLGRSPRTIDGERAIAEVLAERQNTATDNGKEQIMGNLNVNSTTIGFDTLFSIMGFDIYEAQDGNKYNLSYLILKHPIITRMLNGELSKEYLNEIKANNEGNINIDPEQLIKEVLQGEELFAPGTIEEGKEDLSREVLKLFMLVDEISKNILRVNNLTNIQQKQLGSRFQTAFRRYYELQEIAQVLSDHKHHGLKDYISEYSLAEEMLEASKPLLEIFYQSFGLSKNMINNFRQYEMSSNSRESYLDVLRGFIIDKHTSDLVSYNPEVLRRDTATSLSLPSFVKNFLFNSAEHSTSLFTNSFLRKLSVNDAGYIYVNTDNSDAFETEDLRMAVIRLLKDDTTDLGIFNREKITPKKLIEYLVDYGLIVQRGSFGNVLSYIPSRLITSKIKKIQSLYEDSYSIETLKQLESRKNIQELLNNILTNNNGEVEYTAEVLEHQANALNTDGNIYDSNTILGSLSKHSSRGIFIKRLLKAYNTYQQSNRVVLYNAKSDTSYYSPRGKENPYFGIVNISTSLESNPSLQEDTVIHEYTHAIIHDFLYAALGNRYDISEESYFTGVNGEESYRSKMLKVYPQVVEFLDLFFDLRDRYKNNKMGVLNDKEKHYIENAITNPHEFIASVFAYKDFQLALNRQEYKRNVSILSKVKEFINSILQEVMRFIGVPVNKNSMLEAAITSSLNVLEKSNSYYSMLTPITFELPKGNPIDSRRSYDSIKRLREILKLNKKPFDFSSFSKLDEKTFKQGIRIYAPFNTKEYAAFIANNISANVKRFGDYILIHSNKDFNMNTKYAFEFNMTEVSHESKYNIMSNQTKDTVTEELGRHLGIESKPYICY